MTIGQLIPEVIRSRLSRDFKYRARRQLEDLGPSCRYALNLAAQGRAHRELRACRTVADYVAFTQRWLGVGSVQLLEEIQGAIDYLSTESPVQICEIGTEHGGTNLLLSQALPTVRQMIGIDLYIKHKPRLRHLHRPGQQIVFVEGSSHSPATVARVERLLGRSLLDVLFIDGDHTYNGAKSDFLMFRRLVRDDGFILFHDIVFDDLHRFGKATQAWSGGVPLLWSQLKAFYPHLEFVRDSNQDGFGIGVLRYRHAVELSPEFLESYSHINSRP